MIGTVSNAGHGGCDEFHGDRAAYDRADAWCRANCAKLKLQNDAEIETDLELHCSTLLENHLLRKQYLSLVRSNLLPTFSDKPGLYQVRHRGDVEGMASQYSKRHPTARILNLLDEHEALDIFRRATSEVETA